MTNREKITIIINVSADTSRRERYTAKMELIDFHTHVYPEKIAEKATRSVCDFYHMDTKMTGTAKMLISEGKRAGITRFVLLPVAVRPDQVFGINGFIAEEVRQHPEFFGFGTLHAAMEDPTAELDRIGALGLRGIKFHPDTQLFALDDPRLFPVYESMAGRLPLIVHTGDPRYDYSHPRRLRRVIDAFPDLRIIAAHLGGWGVFGAAMEYLKDTDCFFDISSSFMFFPPEKMKKIISDCGPDRFLFGTDFPLWEPAHEVALFYEMDLPPADMEKIAYKNALRLLGEDA